MKTIQRIILISILLFIGIFNGKAQTYVLIPDANFAAALQTIVPSAMSGNSLNTSSSLVTTTTQSISVSGLTISSLSGIQYFSSLVFLDCSYNSLFSLPTLPNSLLTLECNNNSITSLPVLPNSLTYLNCNNNSMASLPVLPNPLVTLDCNYNSITSLLPFSNSLMYLDCSANPISSLPTLPGSLIYLNCHNNLLTNLPALPNTLTYLNCVHNSLTSLPALSSSLATLYCGTNSIVCFPAFPNSIGSINLGPNPFTCLPNYVLPAMNLYLSIPLCVLGNTAGCAVATTIKELNPNNNQISVFPNPNNGSFKIQIEDDIQDGELVLLNSLGQQVHEQKIIRGENDIITKGIPSGLYHYFILENKQQVSNGKLIIE